MPLPGIIGWTTEQLEILRSDKQFSKLYLTVFKPAVIYTALVNGVPASNDRVAQINYDNGSGTLARVKIGMTIRFGTIAGARDLGEERIRKIPTSSIFYFGETSSIKFQDDAYITIVDDYQLWAKHLRISENTFYVDYDIPYSDQHLNFSPMPIMGCHRILWLDEESVSMQLLLGRSWVIGSTISGYLTTCEGAVVANGTTNNPTITFDAPGRYVVYSTITAVNGKSSTGVRYVYVHSSEDMPYNDFELLSLDGNYDAGGFNANVKLFTSSADVDNIEEGALAILHSVDYYNGTRQVVEADNGIGNILMVGRIANENIEYNREFAIAEFAIEGFQERGKATDELVSLSGLSINESGNALAYFSLSRGHLSQNFFPYGVELKASATKWTEMPLLNVKRALFDFLHWYSTATMIMDIFIEDDTRIALELSATGINLWEKLNELAFQTIFARPGVDQFGRMYIEIEPQLIPVDERDSVQIMEIEKIDWTDKIKIERKTGIRGNLEIIDRLLLKSQADSNELAGLYYGWKHNEYPRIGISLSRNNRGFTLFPRQIAHINIFPEDNVRGINLETNLIPREITYSYDTRNGFLRSEVSFEPETFEELNANGDVPGSGDLSLPPALPPMPPIPDFSPIFPGDGTVSPYGPKIVLIGTVNHGLLYSNNFNTEDPGDVTWHFMNNGLSGDFTHGTVDNNLRVFMTPSGSVWIALWKFNSGTGGAVLQELYYATSLGGTFNKIVDRAYLETQIPGDTRGRIAGVAVNPNKSEEIAFIGSNGGDFNQARFFIGGRNGFVKKSIMTVAHGTGVLSFGGGKWIYQQDYQHNRTILNADGSSVIKADNPGTTRCIFRGGTGLKVFTILESPNRLFFSTDGGENYIQINPGGSGNEFDASSSSRYAADPTDMFLMGYWTNSGKRGKSSDGGYTWSGIPNLPFGGVYAYAYAGGSGTSSRWIAGAGILRISLDFGNTWINREGNLLQLCPIGLDIRKIIVPGIFYG
jgi:hypothetical protein